MPSKHVESWPRRDSERGAVLIHVVVAMIGLLGFSGFVIDYGILWSARRQAQNSADAAAIAAATSLGYVDYQDQGRARVAAIAAATNSAVWGEPPYITDADVTFPPCPPGAPPDGLCVRADVYRDQDHNNPLPTFFTQLVGVMDQGVRATATAEVRFGLASTCIKPFAIPDKWDEHRPITKVWEPSDTFERYLKGALLDPADIYRPPVGNTPGSGYDTTPSAPGPLASDYGKVVTIKPSHGRQRLESGFYALVRLGGDEGESDIIDNILGCNEAEIGPGTVLPVEPGGRPGPTARAVQQIIDRDLDAEWSGPSLEAGPFGGVIGSRYGTSPRIIPIAVFDPNIWDADPGGGPGGPSPSDDGPNTVVVTQVIGIFLESTQGNEITGRIVPYPATGHFGSGGIPGEANVINIILVR